MTNSAQRSTNLIELRQYLLHPGQRNALIDLFDREFVETQEAVGMDVLGQFTDPERPNYFVWLRGFTDMTSRAESLAAFYGGPVWAEHSNAANATMIDSDNVMLLRAVSAEDALPTHNPSLRDSDATKGLLVIVIESVDQIDDATVGGFKQSVIPTFETAGFRTLGVYTTESSPNTFPRLPVRSDRAVVWIGTTQETNPAAALTAIPVVAGHDLEHLVLVPTSRSVLGALRTS